MEEYRSYGFTEPRYSNIKRTINRFNSAYRKDSLGDKIIDYTIALESLVSCKNTIQQILLGINFRSEVHGYQNIHMKIELNSMTNLRSYMIIEATSFMETPTRN